MLKAIWKLADPENNLRKEIEQYVIERACRGDREAFSEIYYLLKDSIFGFSYRMTTKRAIAEEITQEVFIFFIENPEKYYPNRGTLFSFLCGVARNKILNHLKKSGTRLETNNLESGQFENLTKRNGNSPFTELLSREVAGKIEEAIAGLPPFQREVLLLREVEDLSYEEIAEITETNVGVVKSRLYRARRSLASELAPYIKNEEVLYEVH
jgi:RNA polymerase sigma-70 factor (ECF subfamily)